MKQTKENIQGYITFLEEQHLGLEKETAELTEANLELVDIGIEQQATINTLCDALDEAVKELETFDLMIMGDEVYADKVVRLKAILKQHKSD